jgi:propionyl-CoA carboxylase alpha chain
VEHAITELVSGEDLVEHMLWVAAGRALPDRLLKLPARVVPHRGWAIESRVYAEDPLRGFLPSIGPLLTYIEPSQFGGVGVSTVVKHNRRPHVKGSSVVTPTVRVDSGVYEGWQISMYYDPMISKLVTHAADRMEAIALMRVTLDAYVIRGVENNLCFLRSVVENESFNRGVYGTSFIAKEYPIGFQGVSLEVEDMHRMVVLAVAMYQGRSGIKDYSDEMSEGSSTDLIDELVVLLPGCTTISGPLFVQTRFTDAMHFNIKLLDSKSGPGQASSLRLNSLEWAPGQPLAKLYLSTSKTSMDDEEEDEDEEEEVTGGDSGDVYGGEEIVMQVESRSIEGVHLRYRGCVQEVVVRTLREHELSRHMIQPRRKDLSRSLLCPMPGTLLSLSVAVGDSVVDGQPLCCVEAMKMQNVLRATRTGSIKAVRCVVGAHLKVDEVILEYE